MAERSNGGRSTALRPSSAATRPAARARRPAARPPPGPARWPRGGPSPADAGHRPRRLDEARIADLVLELLAPHRVANDRLELGVAGAGPHGRTEVGLVEREEAGPQHALGGQADAVAVAAERLRDGRDEADLALAVGEAPAP